MLTSLSVQAAAAGTWPYVATVLLREGQLPSGRTLVSPDDGALRGSILTRWSDGSASVVVVAGSLTLAASELRSVRVQAAVADNTNSNPADALGASRIGQLLSNVAVDFGGPGKAEVLDFSKPERLWWANAQTVCARYRAAAANAGATALEAVIDIHAFASGRALVEIVVENGKIGADTGFGPPAAARYTAAVVSVNGTTVTTVSSSGAPEGEHSQSRAWYASYWVGGDPGLRATQVAADLQAHPLLWQAARNIPADLSGYAADTYTPWTAGRQRPSGMGGAGDHPSIGPLPQWEAQFLQTGDPRAARAVEVSALAIAGFNVSYRDRATGYVPTLSTVAGTSIQIGNWPTLYGRNDAMSWEVAHHPAVGLMAFVCRPSPVYIELAQKVAIWNATWSTTNDGGNLPTGVFGQYYQLRGRAWALRSLAHAIFLTPDNMAWKAPALASLSANVKFLSAWMSEPRAVLNTMWDWSPSAVYDHLPSTPGLQNAVWEYHYLICELHRIASARLLAGTEQAAAVALADWCALQPVRWVNEQPNGGWRYISYETTIGRDGVTVDSPPDWGTMRAFRISGAPSSVAGPLCSDQLEPVTYDGFSVNNTAGAYYPSYWWAALVAARERNVPGAAQAFSTVQANVTNLASWLDGFKSDPRWGPWPRNI